MSVRNTVTRLRADKKVNVPLRLNLAMMGAVQTGNVITITELIRFITPLANDKLLLK